MDASVSRADAWIDLEVIGSAWPTMMGGRFRVRLSLAKAKALHAKLGRHIASAERWRESNKPKGRRR
jgi:hypothetical protein